MIENNKIYNENCLTTMSKISDCSVDLIITSPPYNKNFYTKTKKISKKDSSNFRTINYDSYNDNLSPIYYAQWQTKILNECCRILKETGSIFYNHMDILSDHNTIHPSFIYDFPVKQVLVWDRFNTPKLDKSYFFPINEYVFWIKKSKNSKTKFYRNKMFFKNSIIRIGADTKNPHPAPFPIQLANNFVLGCTDKNDLVYDPFIGSGTTAIASLNNNRNFIGSEISKKYFEMSNKKINQNKSQQKLF